MFDTRIFRRPLGLQPVPTTTVPAGRSVTTSRGPMRGRGRGAAGSRAAGGMGRGQVPGYIRATPTYKKPVEVSVGVLSSCL